MVTKAENSDKSQNYVELTNGQIFDRIKKELNSIQDKLSEKSEKKITIDEAKSELKKINERLQGTKLENKDKKNLGDAFNRLEQNIDENNAKTEFNEIVKILEKLTQKDLANLNREVQQNNKQRRIPSERKPEVQKGIEQSNENFKNQFAYAAKHEKHPVALRAAKKINDIVNNDLA